MDVERQQKIAEIESLRFKQLVESIGRDTLKDMARAGPELQVTHVKQPSVKHNTNYKYSSKGRFLLKIVGHFKTYMVEKCIPQMYTFQGI